MAKERMGELVFEDCGDGWIRGSLDGRPGFFFLARCTRKGVRLELVKFVERRVLLSGLYGTMLRLIAVQAVLLLLMLAFVHFVYRAMVRPIRGIAANMERVEHGIYEYTPQVKGSDEIAVLDRTCAHMVGQIDQLINRDYKNALELSRARLNMLQAQINPHFLNNIMTILIVDDEPAVMEAIQLLLDPAVCPVDHCLYAPNGAKALELLEQEKPDITFCDMQMPLLSGEQLLGELTKRGIQAEIIAVSGYSDFSYVRATVQAGGVDYILKPIDADELNRAFRKAVDHIRAKKQQAARNQDSIQRRADRDLVKWLTGRRKWGSRVQEAFGQIGFPGPTLRTAVLLLKNAQRVIDGMFNEEDAAFYRAVNETVCRCLGGPARVLAVDEYLHVLIFPRRFRGARTSYPPASPRR